MCVCVSVCCSGWFCAQFDMKKSNIGFWVMYMHGWAGKHIAKPICNISSHIRL